jgi:hypothetical protein
LGSELDFRSRKWGLSGVDRIDSKIEI